MTTPKDPWWRRRWRLTTSVTGVAAVCSWSSQVLLAESMPDLLRWTLFGFGVSTTGLTAVLPASYARGQEVLRISAQDAAEKAVKNRRLQTNNIFNPLVSLIARIASSSGQNKRDLKNQLAQMATDFTLRSSEAPQLRACFYELESGPPRRFAARPPVGRADPPLDAFEDYTDRGIKVLNLTANKTTWLVKNTADDYVPGYDRNSASYKSLIWAPVVVGANIYGMLTLDSPSVDVLDEDDRLEVQLIAMLLGIGLAS